MSTPGAGPSLTANRREVNRVIAALSHVRTTNGRALLYGLMLGIALAERAPNTGRALRQDIERFFARESGHGIPEQVELTVLREVDRFDRSLDA